MAPQFLEVPGELGCRFFIRNKILFRLPAAGRRGVRRGPVRKLLRALPNVVRPLSKHGIQAKRVVMLWLIFFTVMYRHRLSCR